MKPSSRPKRFALIFDVLEPVHFGKDVGLFPLYAQAGGGYEAQIVYLGNAKNRGLKAGPDFPVRLVRIPQVAPGLPYRFPWNLIQSLGVFAYLAWAARKIDLLMLFHAKRPSLYLAKWYSFLNPQGQVWLKLDMDGPEAVESGRVKLGRYTKAADLVTVESQEVQAGLNRTLAPGSRQVAYLPNGYDDRLDRPGLEALTQAKQNLFITVGRLGTEQKNSELFLSAIGLSRTTTAQFAFIGPATESFLLALEALKKAHPEKADRIQYLGEIKDRSSLAQWYAKAKALVLTSRWESFGLVLVEAMAQGDYLLSSELPASKDLIGGDPRIGRLFAQEDAQGLADLLDEVASREVDLGPILERSREFRQSAIMGKLGALLGAQGRRH